jgi:D-alanyl-D-alanine carboxypeptidase
MDNASSESDIFSELDAILHRAVELGVPGVSAEICFSRGTLWRVTAGVSNIVRSIPIDGAKHIFGVGSITKVFVAVVFLQLLDEKVLVLKIKSLLTLLQLF